MQIPPRSVVNTVAIIPVETATVVRDESQEYTQERFADTTVQKEQRLHALDLIAKCHSVFSSFICKIGNRDPGGSWSFLYSLA